MIVSPAAVFDQQLDLELKREVAVPPRLVWRAWTEPALLMRGSRRSPGGRRRARSTCGPAAGSAP